MRGPRTSIVGALLLAAVPAFAAEEAAPLESTKQQLRQLESTQKDKAGAAATGPVKFSTPVLETQRDEDGTKAWRAQQKQEERQRQQKRESENWLVNGVEQQGKDGVKPGTISGETTATPEADPLNATRDTSDPQYLLKLFDDQKKRSDAKEPAAKSHAAPAPDPFAPFLQNWLGNSPVRDQVMDQFKKGSETGGMSSAPMGGGADYRAPADAPAGPGATLREPAGPPKPNPYLVELNTPVLARGPVAGGSAMPAVDPVFSSGATSLGSPVAPAPLDPLPDIRPAEKGPAPGQTDNQKYFPQQKKF